MNDEISDIVEENIVFTKILENGITEIYVAKKNYRGIFNAELISKTNILIKQIESSEDLIFLIGKNHVVTFDPKCKIKNYQTDDFNGACLHNGKLHLAMSRPSQFEVEKYAGGKIVGVRLPSTSTDKIHDSYKSCADIVSIKETLYMLENCVGLVRQTRDYYPLNNFLDDLSVKSITGKGNRLLVIQDEVGHSRLEMYELSKDGEIINMEQFDFEIEALEIIPFFNYDNPFFANNGDVNNLDRGIYNLAGYMMLSEKGITAVNSIPSARIQNIPSEFYMIDGNVLS